MRRGLWDEDGAGAVELLGGVEEARELGRSEEHTSELQSHSDLVCRLLLEKKKQQHNKSYEHTPYLPSPNHLYINLLLSPQH